MTRRPSSDSLGPPPLGSRIKGTYIHVITCQGTAIMDLWMKGTGGGVGLEHYLGGHRLLLPRVPHNQFSRLFGAVAAFVTPRFGTVIVPFLLQHGSPACLAACVLCDERCLVHVSLECDINMHAAASGLCASETATWMGGVCSTSTQTHSTAAKIGRTPHLSATEVLPPRTAVTDSRRTYSVQRGIGHMFLLGQGALGS
jgi:hypothetical protein